METKDDVLRFEGEAENEHTLGYFRAHFLTNIAWIFLTVLLAFVPLAVLAFFNFEGLSIPLSTQTVFLYIAAWELFVLAFALQNFFSWYFNIYVITETRVIDIDFYNLFYRRVSQALMRNIEDITYTKGGIAQNFFDYGDVQIQTAGTSENFEFAAIPDPERVQKSIVELVQKARGEKNDELI